MAHGDQGGGYALHVVDDRLSLAWNGYGSMTEVEGGVLSDGATSVVLAAEAVGDLRIHVELQVDGEVVGGARDLPG
ncbi:MAG: hypothetical protein Ct9H300mP12_16710 [Acidimicrobiales bacterium]|nr:MAG: hypothetical protein Ct9H300mP12_16710 [Acidimicrobiales bacterium]